MCVFLDTIVWKNMSYLLDIYKECLHENEQVITNEVEDSFQQSEVSIVLNMVQV